jgi:hypothetical protein
VARPWPEDEIAFNFLAGRRYDSELLAIADSHVAASVRGARRFEKANQKAGGGASLERNRLWG